MSAATTPLSPTIVVPLFNEEAVRVADGSRGRPVALMREGLRARPAILKYNFS